MINELKQKLKELGADDNTIGIALHGETRDKQMQSFNVFLAPHSKNFETIHTLRQFVAKGNDDEILKYVDSAGKMLKKHVFKNV